MKHRLDCNDAGKSPLADRSSDGFTKNEPYPPNVLYEHDRNLPRFARVRSHPAGNLKNLIAVVVYYHFAINGPKWASHLWQSLQRHKLLVFASPIPRGGPNAQFSANTLLNSVERAKRELHSKNGRKRVNIR